MRISGPLLIALLTSIFVFESAEAQSPRRREGANVGASNSPPGAVNDSTNMRNVYRQKVLNDILKKRQMPPTVSAQVFSLQLGITMRSFGASLYETTIGFINRGLMAANPMGPKASFSGLHPRFVQYRFRDKEGELLLGECFLDHYSSKLIPGRTFVRSYNCSVTENARTIANYKGFDFAAVVDVSKNAKVTKYKDVTGDMKQNGQFDSVARAVQYLTDVSMFDDPNKPKDADPLDDDFPPSS